MEPYGDYIIYVDESGDHGLDNINRDYPVFVLSFCIFRKADYPNRVTVPLTELKFQTFGHDMVIFHEHEIVKRKGSFSKMGKIKRSELMKNLGRVIMEAPFTIIGIVIKKEELKKQYVDPENPYHLAMGFGLERIYKYLASLGQQNKLTHIVFEKRGRREDEQLELEFRRVCDGANFSSLVFPFQLIMADKKTNSSGLQLADMTARPIGLSVLRPDQENRAMAILESKLYRNRFGKTQGVGLKVFP